MTDDPHRALRQEQFYNRLYRGVQNPAADFTRLDAATLRAALDRLIAEGCGAPDAAEEHPLAEARRTRSERNDLAALATPYDINLSEVGDPSKGDAGVEQ